MPKDTKVTALPPHDRRFIEAARTVEQGLGECLTGLDSLGLWMAGAHVSRAAEEVRSAVAEREARQPEPPTSS